MLTSSPRPSGRLGTVLTRFTADKLLKAACSSVGLVGVSTHSFRRTALTQMANAGFLCATFRKYWVTTTWGRCSATWR